MVVLTFVMTTARRLLALLLVFGVLSACSTEVTVSQSELDKQLTKQVTPDNPDDEVTVECDGDLAGEVGATQDCPMMVGESPVTARIKVTEVDGTDVKYDITPVVEGEDVAKSIEESLAEQEYPVEGVICEGELIGVMDDAILCSVTSTEGDEVEVESTVTSVDGFLISFDFAQTS